MESNPIKKEDPNAIPGQKTSDKKKEMIAEKVKECNNEKKENSECKRLAGDHPICSDIHSYYN